MASPWPRISSRTSPADAYRRRAEALPPAVRDGRGLGDGANTRRADRDQERTRAMTPQTSRMKDSVPSPMGISSPAPMPSAVPAKP